MSACSNPTQTTKKRREKEEFLSFPFQTIPESLENLYVSEGEKRSFLLGRKTQKLVRVRRAAVSVSFSVIEGEGRRGYCCDCCCLWTGKERATSRVKVR